MTGRIALCSLMLAGLAAPVQAGDPIAQVVCAPRADMVARLQKGYGAELRGSGMRSEDSVIEIWTDAKGDWTLVQTYASGRSCILAMGEAWEVAGPLPPA